MDTWLEENIKTALKLDTALRIYLCSGEMLLDGGGGEHEDNSISIWTYILSEKLLNDKICILLMLATKQERLKNKTYSLAEKFKTDENPYNNCFQN